MAETGRGGRKIEGSRTASVAIPLERWEGCTAAELAALWRVPRVELYRLVESTNDLASVAADAGVASGTVVLAEKQLAGRGRQGRGWASAEGLGFWASMVARPRPEHLGAIPLRVGVAIARALDPWAGADGVRVKWPNDLLLDGRKLGGILCEASWAGNRLDHLIVGIGLNLLHTDADFPDLVRLAATSLRATGQPISRFDVASRVISSVLAALDDPEKAAVDWRKELSRRDALAGRVVEVLEPDTGRAIASGRVTGVAADGALQLEGEEGSVTVRSGTVRLMEQESG